MSYRDDEDALRLRASDLDRERVRVDRELAGVQRDLAERAARAAPVRLANVRIAAPCSEPWDRMTGDERARHCAKCDLDVFDLSQITTADAEALLAAHGTRLCVRFFRRADGTVMTKDCPVGVKRRRRVVWFTAGAIAAGAAAASAVGLPMATPAADALATPAVATCLPDPPPEAPPAKHVARTVVVPEEGARVTGGPPPLRNDWETTINPREAAALRISGNQKIEPPASVQRAMRRDGQTRFVGAIGVSIAVDGTVARARTLKSTGYDAYDRKLVHEIGAWRYRPFKSNGVATPADTVVTVIYLLRTDR